ncbi:hypothetical protein D9619_009826 [Psilocybe cf. subviscida]|uniref:DUF6535 domain-containing protein n=1 Tax=Psilocybe cf. subviscida TaxID=2480587 RepID=A0A8H5BL90_9AGAR|nr:hypothetical protein D9619_009826 [Psilocybe cf. subviscida]
MSSEPGLALSIESASAGEREATWVEGGDMSFDPCPQAVQSSINLCNDDVDTIQEQRMVEPDSMYWLPEVTPALNPSTFADLPHDIPIPELPKPGAIPKPDFEHLLKPMLEQDTIQCNAWKDEVQNLLIFAGLFSAVVTAFIIESYQRLQPDPNDTIVSLLARIAEKLDNPSVNGTVSVSSIVSNTNFSPSRPDININIFWFVSLILSLTVALVGIITLQWLREHQRYDTLKPYEKMAILHMRLDSLERWYVPQIFAGLPLLLQAALVAIPVTLTICIPLVFLITTTILPLLQVYALQDPFRLSINKKVPSPCPYKSPQSLILRRIGIHSATLIKFITAIFTGAYTCVVQVTILIRKLAGRSSSMFDSRQHDLQNLLQNHGFRDICRAQNPAQWTSIDVSWIGSRTQYTILSQVVKGNNPDLVADSSSFGFNSKEIMSAGIYDCTRCLRMILVEDRATADHRAIYHCMASLLSQAMDTFRSHYHYSAPNLVRWAEVDFAFVLGQMLCDVYVERFRSLDPIDTAAFIEDAIFRNSLLNGSQTTVEALCAAFVVLSQQDLDDRSAPLASERTIADDAASAFTLSRLSISPSRLFAMSSGDMWYPQFLQAFSYVSGTPMSIILQSPIY